MELHIKRIMSKKIDPRQKIIVDNLKDDFLNSLSSIITSSEVLKDMGGEFGDTSEGFLKFLNKYVEVTKSIREDFSLFLWALEPGNDQVQKVIEKLHDKVLGFLNYKPDAKVTIIDTSLHNQDLPALWNFQLLKISSCCLESIIAHTKATQIKVAINMQDKNMEIKFLFDDVSVDFSSLAVSCSNQLYKKINSLGFSLTSHKEKNTQTLLLKSK